MRFHELKLRLHRHDFRYDLSGYIDWVPAIRPVQWITVSQCIKCDEKRCTVRSTEGTVKLRSELKGIK